MSAAYSKLLVANRGEIACRIFRAAQSLDIPTVGVCAEDDTDALHTRRCDELVELPGSGPAAYLDVAAIVDAAVRSGADALHPGYGFLSESPELARACRDAGVTFVGPSAEAMALLGDKSRARQLAVETGTPVLPGTHEAELADILDFWDAEVKAVGADAAVVVKAVAGGGGRGVRIAHERSAISAAYAECAAEAQQAFGNGAVYVERYLPRVHHVEVQIVADSSGQVSHLWDRDCSIQRRHQKLIEVAPSRVLTEQARARMLDSAVELVRAAGLVGLATVEFIAPTNQDFYFIEVNPRLQVEHTVTEEVLGLDLVNLQLQLAAGAALGDLGVDQTHVPAPHGQAVEVRINAERMLPDGGIGPSVGTVSELDLPGGAGVRVEAAAYRGMSLSPRYDSLIAKIVVHGRDPEATVRIARQALVETHVEGIETNLAIQQAVLSHDDFLAGTCDTGWFERHVDSLLAPVEIVPTQSQSRDEADPVEDDSAVRAEIGGVVVEVDAAPGVRAARGDLLVTLEAMKMQYPVAAARSGLVTDVKVAVGDVVAEGQLLVTLDPDHNDALADNGEAPETIDLDTPRTDLESLLRHRRVRLDESRGDAVEKRHRSGRRTARENIAAVTDTGLVVEYGGFAVAAQRNRRDLADLEVKSPADGIVTGLGRVHGDLFEDRSTCAVLAYDYTVMAGTQGYYNHQKTDRLLEIARERQYPVLLFAEGGGGRPNDSDVPIVAGLHYKTFAAMGRLTGTVPTVGIAAGRCFAGNAALLGMCDVVIATADSSIGMGGPAMIEGGGLGQFTADEVGPIEVQTRNGVVDVAVADETEAAAVARTYLSYFQGDLPTFEAPDPRALRHVVPEDRRRVYDMRSALNGLVDIGSLLELRAQFGRAAITALARIDGKPVGLIANQPMVNGGAIDADAADKLARFLRLCENYALPVVSLCDTPGFMVGPDSEQQATVRHFPRLFVLGGHMTVPMVTVVLRKAYGLGALAMAAGGFHNTSLTVSWPTGEFGGMGIEGAVKLGARDFLAAIDDPAERQKQFDDLVAYAYAQGSAINTARHLEIDEVIDPADTRSAVIAALLATPGPPRAGWQNSRSGLVHDTW